MVWDDNDYPVFFNIYIGGTGKCGGFKPITENILTLEWFHIIPCKANAHGCFMVPYKL